MSEWIAYSVFYVRNPMTSEAQGFVKSPRGTASTSPKYNTALPQGHGIGEAPPVRNTRDHPVTSTQGIAVAYKERLPSAER